MNDLKIERARCPRPDAKLSRITRSRCGVLSP